MYYASRDAMDIDNLGESTIDKLLDKELIDNIADLYFLKKEDILKLEGFKEKSANNLLESIEKSKNQDLSRLIYGLGIRHVGKYAAQLLAQKYKSIDELAKTSSEEQKDIDGLGDKTAEAIGTFFATSENINLIKKLKDIGLKTQETKNIYLPFKDKKFVFTGTLSSFSRNDASDHIKKKGGIITSSVSKDIDYIVVGDNPGSKYEKARKLHGAKIEFKKAHSKLRRIESKQQHLYNQMRHAVKESQEFHVLMTQSWKDVEAKKKEADKVHKEYLEAKEKADLVHKELQETRDEIKKIRGTMYESRRKKEIERQKFIKERLEQKAKVAYDKLKDGGKLTMEEFTILVEKGLL